MAAALDGTVIDSPAGKRPVNSVVVRTPNDRTTAFEVEWAGEGWPQDVRAAARGVGEPWPSNVVLIARELSPGAIAWLRARGANWADETGQVRILGPEGLVVIREPTRPKEVRERRWAGWSPSAVAVAEVILAREDRALSATELATSTGWSIPQSANVLSAFDAQGWTVKRGAARGPGASRRLIDADALLASWSAAVAAERRPTRLAHRSSGDLMGFLQDQLGPALDSAVRWAVSGWAGLDLAAPFASTTPNLHIYIAENQFAGPVSTAIAETGLQEVEEGGRVIFWATNEHVLKLAHRAHGVPVVSAPRLYADLSKLGARGQDAADHAREQLIDPLHPSQAPDNG
ncbi:MAG: type IV toxin-antitoxin system AbiEi family antitoxin [Solirubrobacteraceae bacterium]